MQHSSGNNGDASRSTGEAYPLPTKLKTTDAAGATSDISAANPLPVFVTDFSDLPAMSITKLDSSTPVLTKTGAATVSLKAGTSAKLPTGRAVYFPADTVVTMPALAAGTDYAVYVTPDGNVVASANFSAPAGYNAATILKIGGFHYANGGNATAQAGGDATAAINAYSLWDLKFKPACLDARGMTLVAGAFWCDIYLTGTNPDVDGTSKFGATIADGSSPAKIPAMFGGNGTTDYGAFKWWHALEVGYSAGKQLLDYAEFCAAAYGTTEGTNVTGSADPGTTQRDANHTSRWGVMQATGNMYIWGRGDALDPSAATAFAWSATTESRGSIYQSGGGLKAPLFGGYWGDGSVCGSRSCVWSLAPSISAINFGARFRCDHLVLT